MALPRPIERTRVGGMVQQAEPSSQPPRLLETTLFISNLHCPSCVTSIEETLSALSPKPSRVSPSILSHSVSVSHDTTLPAPSIIEALEHAGFEIHSVFQEDAAHRAHRILPETPYYDNWEDSLEQAVRLWRQTWLHSTGKGKQARSSKTDEAMGRQARHAEQCPECQNELNCRSTDELPLREYASSRRFDRNLVSGLPYAVSHYANSASLYEVRGSGALDYQSSGSSEILKEKPIEVVVGASVQARTFKADLAIAGMTCSSCVASITDLVEALPWVDSIQIALLTNSAVVVFRGNEHVGQLVEVIEDAGFEVSIESLDEVVRAGAAYTHPTSDTWKATWTIDGMSCSSCVAAITEAIKQHQWVRGVDINLISNSGTVTFEGKDHLAALTETIEDAGFNATPSGVVNVATMADKHVRERHFAIRIDGMYCHHCPPKILGMLGQEFSGKIHIEAAPTLKVPILRVRYIPDAPTFTVRSVLGSLEELDAALRPTIYHPPTIEDKSAQLHDRERRRILFRLALSVSAAIPAFIIGVVCMSLLKTGNPIREYVMKPMWAGTVSRAEWALFILSTPVYFFAADTFHRKALKEVWNLWRRGSRTPIVRRLTRFGSMNMLISLGTSIAYFSSVAELIMAAVEKPAPAADEKAISSTYFDSVIFLTMFLLAGRFVEAYSKAKAGDAVTKLGKLRGNEAILVDTVQRLISVVPVDQLEVDDIVRVHPGASPPFDGIIVEGETSFDESSLTGEARPVAKRVGDVVYSGTVNKQGPIKVRVTSVDGTGMLDQIINIVREGQARRAPVERVVDLITSHFVPFVIAIGVSTWLIWLTLGEVGALPRDWLDPNSSGGWPLWSLRFSIAVFVIACPCGIGLAAPTALFVGGGLAAKHGILAKGGGEAFQEASKLDCIVFDKTGTLTEGSALQVTDYQRCCDDEEVDVLGMTMALEQHSSHPIAGAIAQLCKEKHITPLDANTTEELPGRGMRGTFTLDAGSKRSIEVEVLIGNERLMSENDVNTNPVFWSQLQSWKQQGKSVACVAIRTGQSKQQEWTLSAIFAIADATRSEAASVVTALRSRGVEVWMLSGDNQTTALAVAARVGIDPGNVIAGVLPDQKAEKIQYLQRSLPWKGRGKNSATVAMVGDGVNDAPALTMADVGIAIGSGSDVAISSADFILVSSNLGSLLTLIDLSRTVFRRVWFNFGWALVYNLIAMPVAAGVLYPVRTSSGGHVRLDPVWASLAMALSSVSVVSSSLLLRSRLPLVGFRGTPWATEAAGGGRDRRE